MKVINRSAVVVKHKAPYNQWLESFGDEGLISSEMRREPSLYLVNELFDQGDLERYLYQQFHSIFANELMSWTDDESLWPTLRDYATFSQWFEIETYAMVFDTLNVSIQAEEL